MRSRIAYLNAERKGMSLTSLPEGVGFGWMVLTDNSDLREIISEELKKDDEMLKRMSEIRSKIESFWESYLLDKYKPKQRKIIEKYKPNLMLGVPTMFINLLNYPGSENVDFSSLKYANVGAGSLPAEIFKVWKEKTGFEMGEGYGLSETSPTVTKLSTLGKKEIW